MDIIVRIFGQLLQAQGQAAPAQPSFGEIFSRMTPMFLTVFLIFYFMVIKPQQTKIKSQEALLKDLKRGDTVLTSSGIIARVASIEEDCVVLEVSSNVKVKFERSHIAKKIDPRSAEKSA